MSIDLTIYGTLVLPEGPLENGWLGIVAGNLGGRLAWDGKLVVNQPGAGQYVRRGGAQWF